jgi:N-acetyl-gamma-glutamyl-phosphate reductase
MVAVKRAAASNSPSADLEQQKTSKGASERPFLFKTIQQVSKMPKSNALSKIAILGASGYTGAELIRLLHSHPHVEIKYLVAETQAGKKLSEVYPHLGYANLPNLVHVSEVDWQQVDFAFGCLPHGTSQPLLASLPPHVRIIDLSADFRLRNTTEYAHWYGHAHQAVELQKQAIYGLTEHTRDAVKKARLVANPGCYPTASQLPLIPLLEAGLIDCKNIIIDAKSGVTGAGRSLKQNLLFTEVDGGLAAYGIGNHRHTPEIEQGLTDAAKVPVQVTFTPHLIPMKRGILATIYASLTAGKTVDDIRAALAKTYASEPFVDVLNEGEHASTQQVFGTNRCVIAAHKDRVDGRVILVSAIDNLCKGASGQAVQNMNVMLELPETTGLPLVAVFP